MPPDKDTPDRLPPQSREAERSVLGSMLRDNAVIDDVTPKYVQADHFYADAHQKIFLAIQALHQKAAPVDLITLAEELKQRGQIEDVGGYGYLGELWDAAPTAAHATYYAQIVRDRAIVRRLIHAGTEILRDAYDQSQSPDELLNTAERKILEVAEMGLADDAVTLEQAIKSAYDRIDKRQGHEGLSISDLSPGFRDLDKITDVL
jgi:replicative DNA helicase